MKCIRKALLMLWFLQSSSEDNCQHMFSPPKKEKRKISQNGYPLKYLNFSIVFLEKWLKLLHSEYLSGKYHWKRLEGSILYYPEDGRVECKSFHLYFRLFCNIFPFWERIYLRPTTCWGNGNTKLYHNAIIYVIKLFHGSIGMCKLWKTVKCNNVSDIIISNGLFILQELYTLMLIWFPWTKKCFLVCFGSSFLRQIYVESTFCVKHCVKCCRE